MKHLTLTLVVSLIMESVKGETMLKGRADRAADGKLSKLSFEESAGDEQFHERKLYRTMNTSLSRLKSRIGDYVENVSARSGDNVFSSVSSESDSIVLRLLVSDRFNESFTDDLARLCSKFIEDHMLYLWWGTLNVKQADFYKSLYELDLEDIMSCFAKTAPSIPSAGYTESIDTQMGDTFSARVGESITLTYQVSDGCIDDVEVEIEDPSVAHEARKIGKSFVLRCRNAGVTGLRLYSRHDETVYKDVVLKVSEG